MVGGGEIVGSGVAAFLATRAVSTALASASASMAAQVRRLATLVRGSGVAKGMQSVGAAVNRTISIPLKQVEKKFEAHAADFGVTLQRGRDGFDAMKSAIEAHVADPDTLAIPGTFRWTEEVTYFFNPRTDLLVIRDGDGVFRSGWKLDTQQVTQLLERGNVW